MKTALALGAVLLAAGLASAQPPAAPARTDSAPPSMGGGDCADNVYNCPDTPNPLPPPNTVWIEEMTWMDVRDALKAGKTTVIIATGGMEPNGPWLVTGKHNYVNRANCESIARKLGNALCAPLIKLVPEGNYETKSSHMASPGTLSLRETSFRAMLTDVVHSLRMHGFKTILLIGDSGGNQSGQRAVADSLTALWKGDPIVAHIQEYYTYSTVSSYMESRGIERGPGDGLHDDPIITLNMFITDPSSVRYEERVKAGKATINGFSIADRVKSLELARQIVEFRANHTIEAINAAIANKGTVAAAGRGGRGEGGGAGGAAGGGRGAGRGAGRAGGGRAGGGGGGAGGGGGRGRGRGGTPLSPADSAAQAALRARTMGGGDCGTTGAAIYNCVDTPNPLPAPNTVRIEEMTWMDVRDALKAGKTTAIISTGGIEPNGPWLVTGKHNYVLRANCDLIARKLGNALCAPVMELVPEGRIEPKGGHMRSPGTISLREETFRAVLWDVAQSLKAHGFTNIILIGDSGGNRNGMAWVADTLTKLWNGSAAAIHIPEYYQRPAGAPRRNVLREQGVTRDSMPSDGLHDSPGITLNMMLDDINSVRWAERVKTDQAVINGVSIADLARSLELAKMIAEERTEYTAGLIRQRIASRPR
jgi:creatinine amidohydrolase/Fe(II)-dependent formamide hydrolase-like protein